MLSFYQVLILSIKSCIQFFNFILESENSKIVFGIKTGLVEKMLFIFKTITNCTYFSFSMHADVESADRHFILTDFLKIY